MHRFAAILTHNRPELLRETWAAIRPQVDLVTVIDNASEPRVQFRDFDQQTVVLGVPDQPPNLSRLWNLAITQARMIHGNSLDPEPGRLAVLCDDAPPPEGWFDAVCAAMDEVGAPVGASAPEPFGWHGPPTLKVSRDSDMARRMPGWAWIVDLDSGVRADERFEWWWGDTDLDWQARERGGMVLIGTHPVPNRRPNEFSARPPQAAQVAQDSARFVEKYGWRPW